MMRFAPRPARPSRRDRALAPYLRDRIGELQRLGRLKLLSVSVDRLRAWQRPGLLCIGDAAHAMSPVGGVGINLAIQDAVAAANILADALRQGRVSEDDLDAVERRRDLSDPRESGDAGIYPEPGDRPGAREHWKAFDAVGSADIRRSRSCREFRPA